VVLDAHLDWCGHCEAILPSMSRILVDFDAAETRFSYCAIDRSKFARDIQKTLPSDSEYNLASMGCTPLFIIYKNREVVAVVPGVDTPSLMGHIKIMMPKKAVD
jgi:thiol-disulfide isomerase/thioredoxin